MERYDAAIAGAGPEELIAAIVLARAGRRVIVLERQGRAGGRAETYEFHPGFKASPYADELALIPARLLRTLDLARQGALLIPAPASVCISSEGTHALYSGVARSVPAQARAGLVALRRERESLWRALDARSAPAAPSVWWERFSLLRSAPRSARWPGEDWTQASLDEVLKSRISDSALRLHLAAGAASGRAVSPYLTGTALHLLAPGTGQSGMAAGGLGRLGLALERIAIAAGAVMRYGAEVKELRVKRRRASALVLSGGEEVQARAVLSSLDAKRSFLKLIKRGDLSAAVHAQASGFRMTAQGARVLFALDGLPELKLPPDEPELRFGPIHVVASLQAMSAAEASFQTGVLPVSPLVTLRLPSLSDPSLAPLGKAVMTATISAVPGHLLDGPWTPSARARVAGLALEAAERLAPGVTQRVLGWRSIVASDVEAALGLTAGDYAGGELAPDQALGFRPFGGAEWRDGRTPLKGFYLGGPSAAPSPCLTGVSGERAARALLADLDAEERQ